MKTFFVFIFSFLLIQTGNSQTTKTEFADILVTSYYSNSNKNYTNFYGGSNNNFPILINPNVVLGNNTKYFLSLPQNSYVIVQFTDNQIIDFPNQNDIFITENGCSGEHAEVYVSSNGVDYIKLGIVDDCKTSSLDLNKINFKSVVRFVKIVGLDNNGASPGFDLVNVKGLPNSSIDSYIGLAELDKYIKSTDTLIKKKVILKNVYFNFNSDLLNDTTKKSLDSLVSKLLKYPAINIKITGFTDNVGDDDLNLKLSKNRAKAVYNYLIFKGIKKAKMVHFGKGETEPLKSNETEEGRKANRRVEFEIIK